MKAAVPRSEKNGSCRGTETDLRRKRANFLLSIYISAQFSGNKAQRREKYPEAAPGAHSIFCKKAVKNL
ncbi:MAG: hypothetical protein IJQ25_04005 [Oscillibacter sp.]|nr:hypothetical protein [Oscillibacter sp.]